MSDKLRIGIIGLGFIGTQKHLVGLAQHKDRTEVVAFCDFDIERAEAGKAQWGNEDAYTTTDYMDLVNDPDIDVIHVCTWNANHCEITCAALEAGKHVMVEKPMAVTGEDARKMRDTAKRVGKKLTVGFQYRQREEYQFLKALADEGKFGEIYAAKAHATRRRGVPIWGVFTDKSKQGGGPLIDLGGHSIDVALWLMNNYEVASVTGVVNHKLGDKPQGNIGGEWDPATYEVEDSAFGFVTFKNGASLFVEASWALNLKAAREGCITIHGTEAGAETIQDPNGSANLVVDVNLIEGGKQVNTTFGEGGAYFSAGGVGGAQNGFAYMGGLEAGLWIDAILNDTEPYVTADQAVVVTEILDGIYTSAAQGGKPVYFD